MAMTNIPNSMTKIATILDTEHHLSFESFRKHAVGMMKARGTAVKQPYSVCERERGGGGGIIAPVVRVKQN